MTPKEVSFFMKTEKKVTTIRRVVKSANADEYERLFNKMAAELAEHNPVIKDIDNKDLFVSYFTYEETEVKEVPETVEDEFKLQGIEYCCEACPHLEIGHNKARKKWPCMFSKYGQSRKDSKACELFYKELAQGLVKPREEFDDD